MSENKFKTSIMGFNKTDINNYLEKLLKDFETNLDKRDNEINSLKEELEKIQGKYDNVSIGEEDIEKNKDLISKVLIKAEVMANEIISDAQKRADEIDVDYNKIIEDAKAEAELIIEKAKENAIKIESSEIEELKIKKAKIQAEFESEQTKLNNIKHQLMKVKDEILCTLESGAESLNNIEDN